jgi:hypothetical protein
MSQNAFFIHLLPKECHIGTIYCEIGILYTFLTLSLPSQIERQAAPPLYTVIFLWYY